MLEKRREEVQRDFDGRPVRASDLDELVIGAE
jgi:hypothetical protein